MSVLKYPRSFYEGLIAAGDGFQSFLLLAIRLYWGYSFFMAGYGKLLDSDKLSSFFQSIAFPFPYFTVLLVTYVELIGGLCLLFGFASRFAALLLAITMVGAILLTEWNVLLHITTDAKKFITLVPFIYLFASLIIFAFGPGKFSIDYLLQRYLFKRR